MEVFGELVKILAAAIAGAVGVWATEPRRLKSAVDVEVVKARLQDNSKVQDNELALKKELRESERTITNMRSEHEAALQRKEREILQSLAAEYARDLRGKRIDAYEKLWAELELLNLYHPKADLKYADLAELGEKLRKWYFTDGGLLLSKSARNAYFKAQDALIEVIRAAEAGATTQDIVRARAKRFTLPEVKKLEEELRDWRPGADSMSDFLQVRKAFSTLRSKLCDDVGTRAVPVFARPESASPNSVA